MGTIHKLTRGGQTIFPATVSDAVVHPQLAKTVTDMIMEYNVSVLFPTSGNGGGDLYTLNSAITVLKNALSSDEKVKGVRVVFKTAETGNPLKCYSFNATSGFNNENNWIEIAEYSTFDNIPKASSKNLVKSGGIYADTHLCNIPDVNEFVVDIVLKEGVDDPHSENYVDLASSTKVAILCCLSVNIGGGQTKFCNSLEVYVNDKWVNLVYKTYDTLSEAKDDLGKLIEGSKCYVVLHDIGPQAKTINQTLSFNRDVTWKSLNEHPVIKELMIEGNFYLKNPNIIIEEDGIYQVKDNLVYPVSHPDLSTQPSTLPQRYGNLNLHEALIADGRESDIPYNAVVIKSFSFNNETCVPSICKKQKVGDKRTITPNFDFPITLSELDGKTMTANFNVTSRDVKNFLKITTSEGEEEFTEENGVYKLGELQFTINGKTITFKYNDPYNGYYDYVDLGLPSGLKWASFNIGAKSSTDQGLYFAWGETTGYADASEKSFSWSDYKWGDTKYNESDGKTVLEPVDDAAHTIMGGSWRMPTEAEFNELLNTTYVTNAWVTNYTGSSVNGRLFTSVSNGNTLFIPASGYYNVGSLVDNGSGYVWSSSLFLEAKYTGLALVMQSMGSAIRNFIRCVGIPVRGVVNATMPPSTEITSISYIEPVVKENGWRIENIEGIIPDFTLVQYYGEDNDYYYSGSGSEQTDDGQLVDLGLPSGLKWAKCNIGANTETDYGLFFSWGGTWGYANASSGKSFSWSDYEWGDGKVGPSGMTKYNSTDGKTVLEPEDDAAYKWTNGAWRMPTATEFEELLNTTYVTNAWVKNYKGSGVNGRLFTSVSNGNTLFFPDSGYCGNGSLQNRDVTYYVWSSSVDSSNLHRGLYLSGVYLTGDNRCFGMSVRGVSL